MERDDHLVHLREGVHTHQRGLRRVQVQLFLDLAYRALLGRFVALQEAGDQTVEFPVGLSTP
jgi:hypothetical protein